MTRRAVQLDLIAWGATRPNRDPPTGTAHARALWLQHQIHTGTLTRHTVATAAGINASDVPAILEGRTRLGPTTWRKIHAAMSTT